MAKAVAPPPTASQVPHWTCQASVSGPITVGQTFSLNCQGGTAQLNQEHLNLQLPEAQKYLLKILKVQGLTANQADFLVTGYVVSPDIKISNLSLVDGETGEGHQVILDGIQFSVQSVITPQNNPENKPFGPWGPARIDYPLWLWILLALMISSFVAAVFLRWRKMRARRLFLRELEKNPIVLSPYNLFNKELRTLGRQYPMGGASSDAAYAWSQDKAQNYVTELDRSFRWYLARELLIPTKDQSVRMIVGDLRRRHRKFSETVEKDLRVALNELNNALKVSQKVTAVDAQQLTELCRKIAETISQQIELQKNRGGRG
jgi:hypothetical protein